MQLLGITIWEFKKKSALLLNATEESHYAFIYLKECDLDIPPHPTFLTRPGSLGPLQIGGRCQKQKKLISGV